MLYKYSTVLDINPNKYDEVKRNLDKATVDYNSKLSSLQEVSIKEQLKFYVNKNVEYSCDRARMLNLIDKL